MFIMFIFNFSVCFSSDASTSSEAVHLQQRLRNLSSELLTLRTRLHPSCGTNTTNTVNPPAPEATSSGGICGQTKIPHSQQELRKSSCLSKKMPGLTRKTENILSDVQDLIHLPGPLTEDAVLRTLHARFYMKEYFTNIGPVLLSLNPYHSVSNPLTLASTHQEASKYPQLAKVVHEAVRQQSETGYPQAIILSGESGSGKTFASMIFLRQLFDVAGGGKEI